ncbi:hypothetical protein QR680_018565 [Steinernema hermaphroditum]|uniref:Choline transporter-like protein n=1 Tax=Steinernema hermaphroditum TaxID=289476 RepID=A0AA39LRB2_9BILA|nr:hypothetical protein QR680_018565 [Steinernema hermaphroditum]
MGKDNSRVHQSPTPRHPPPPFNPHFQQHVYPTAPPQPREEADAARAFPMYPPLPHPTSPEAASRLLSPPAYAPPISADEFQLIDKDSPEGSRKPANFSFTKPPGKNPITSTRRGCTDVLCCLLIIAFILGWGFVAVLGFMWGKPERIIHPTDSKGRICGYDRPGYYNMSSKPYLLFFDLTRCVSYSSVFAGCQTPQVCVEECPREAFSYLKLQVQLPMTNFKEEVRRHVICEDPKIIETINNFEALRTVVQQGICTSYTVASTPVFGRCIPDILVKAGEALNDAQQANSTLDQLIQKFGSDGDRIPSEWKIANSTAEDKLRNSKAPIVQKIAYDLSKTWWQILTLLFASAIISFIWIFVIRILGGLMIWLSMLGVVAFLAAGAGFCWYRFTELRDAGAVNDFSFQPDFSLYLEMPATWLIFAIIISVVLAITLIIICFIRSRIRLATKLIAETSKALNNMTSTLFFPLLPFVMHMLVFVLWATIAIWLATSGEENCRRKIGIEPIENGEQCDCGSLGVDPNCQYVNLTKDSNRIMGLQAYNLFGFFWLTCFVSGLAQTTLAGAFASYYWAFKKPRDVPSLPVLRSFGRALRYNMGSIAFGSLILAIVKFFRAILDFLQKRLVGAENVVLKFIYRALSCLFYILEHVLKFLTKRAYIMIAIYGKGFCRSARDSFSLVTRNIVRVVVLDRVTTFLLFLGKATITLGMGAVAFIYFTGRWDVHPIPRVDLYYYFVPVIVVLIGSYYICDTFFDVYEMGVNTIFLCFLEDSENNDGSTQKPFYMSDSLKKILGNQNQFSDAS